MKSFKKINFVIIFQLLITNSLLVVPFLYQKFERSSFIYFVLGLILFLIISLMFPVLSFNKVLRSRLSRILLFCYMFASCIFTIVTHLILLCDIYYVMTNYLIITLTLFIFLLFCLYIKKEIMMNAEFVSILILSVSLLLVLLQIDLKPFNLELSFDKNNSFMFINFIILLGDYFIYLLYFNLNYNVRKKMIVPVIFTVLAIIFILLDYFTLPKMLYTKMIPNLFKYRYSSKLYSVHFDSLFLVTCFLGCSFKLFYFIDCIKIVIKKNKFKKEIIIISVFLFLTSILIYSYKPLYNQLKDMRFYTMSLLGLLFIGGYFAGIFKKVKK